MKITMRQLRLSLVSFVIILAAGTPVLAQPVRNQPQDAAPVPRQAPAKADTARKKTGPARVAPIVRARVSQSSEPTFDDGLYRRIGQAILVYSAIEVRGGWPALRFSAQLGPGSMGPEVVELRRRLAITDDLPAEAAREDVYDDTLVEAVRRFQIRHGLPDTGTIGPQTLAALNVPVSQRLRQLAGSRDRLTGLGFAFGVRYVVVNIPGAFAEAIEDGRVVRRYVAVVGKPDRPSPVVTTQINAVNLNPTWTVPLSIVKKDIMTKMRKDPTYVSRMRMRLLDGRGGELDPRNVDWSSSRSPNFTIRQDSGAWNALGAVRIDMPNGHAVYMHDTPSKNLFNADYRFQSSGCARIADVRDLAAWLLKDNPGWSRRDIDAGIGSGRRVDIRLTRPVPVAWIYATGWATHDGTVHFRNDVYGHDRPPERLFMAARTVQEARSGAFLLQSAEPDIPQVWREVSYLDSQ